MNKHKLSCLVHPDETRLGSRGHIFWDDISHQPRILDRIVMNPTAYFMDWEGTQVNMIYVSGLDKPTRIAHWRVEASAFLSQLEWSEIDEGTVNHIFDPLGLEWKYVHWSLLTENEVLFILKILQGVFLDMDV